jgi:hypothetical protein
MKYQVCIKSKLEKICLLEQPDLSLDMEKTLIQKILVGGLLGTVNKLQIDLVHGMPYERINLRVSKLSSLMKLTVFQLPLSFLDLTLNKTYLRVLCPMGRATVSRGSDEFSTLGAQGSPKALRLAAICQYPHLVSNQ